MLKLTDTSESFGLPATADLMFALISTEELEELGQLLVKQLKNRYNDQPFTSVSLSALTVQRCVFMIVNRVLKVTCLTSKQEEEYDFEDRKPKKSFEDLISNE